MSKVRDYINVNLDFEDEYYRLFGKRIGSSGHMFCPFHNNVNTPAAKYYKDSGVCHCFVCQRSYTVYDLLREFDGSRIDEIRGSMVIPSVQRDVSRYSNLFVSIDRGKDISIIVKEIINSIGNGDRV